MLDLFRDLCCDICYKQLTSQEIDSIKQYESLITCIAHKEYRTYANQSYAKWHDEQKQKKNRPDNSDIRSAE